MYTTYILYSQKLNKYYSGSTENIDKRLKAHNSGKVRFTSRGMPWILIREINSFKGGIKFKKLIKK